MYKKNVWLGIGMAIAAGAVIWLRSRKTIPDGVSAVSNFEKNKYLGTWYEIARFDFRFEKNLSHVKATYSALDNGSIKVVNTGYDYKKYRQRQSIGGARFVNDENIGMLKVSFFGPFYAGYNVIAIDDNYQYALVCGNSRKFLWILSREKTIPEVIKDKYLKIAKDAGFNISNLVWTEQQ